MRSKAGFSVIEALVAIMIAAIGLTAILELQHQLVTGQERYEKALARTTLRRNALTLLQNLNPEVNPTGETELGPKLTLRWTSTPITAARQNAGIPAGDGQFQVRLYSVDATISDSAGKALDRFKVERLGWKRTAVWVL